MQHTIKENDNLWELVLITDVVVNHVINNNADSNDDASSGTDMEGSALLSDSN